MLSVFQMAFAVSELGRNFVTQRGSRLWFGFIWPGQKKKKAEGGSHYFLALVGSIASPSYSVYSFFSFFWKNGIWNQIVLVKIKGVIPPVLLCSTRRPRRPGTGNKRLHIKTRVIVNSTWRPVPKRGLCFLVMSWILNSNLNPTSKGNELKINSILKAAK